MNFEKKKEIIVRINRVAKLTGDFALRSGKRSNVYFDKYKFESDPELLNDIIEEMISLIPEDTEVLAGLEMGGIPIVTLLSNKMKMPAAFIRKKAKEYGTCKYAEGTDLQKKKVTIIEDVVSSGGAIIDAVDKMRNDNIDVKYAVCVIDRETGGKENLLKQNIELLSFLKQFELESISKT